MVKFEWGMKRTCSGCSARFYDLQKSPPTCPKCGTVMEPSVGNRRTRARGQAVERPEVLGADDAVLTEDLVLDVEIEESEEGEEEGLMEDTSDLAEDLEDLDVLDTSSEDGVEH